MYCGNCGTKLPEGSAFCPGCGAAQEGGEESSRKRKEGPDRGHRDPGPVGSGAAWRPPGQESRLKGPNGEQGPRAGRSQPGGECPALRPRHYAFALRGQQQRNAAAPEREHADYAARRRAKHKPRSAVESHSACKPGAAGKSRRDRGSEHAARSRGDDKPRGTDRHGPAAVRVGEDRV